MSAPNGEQSQDNNENDGDAIKHILGQGLGSSRQPNMPKVGDFVRVVQGRVDVGIEGYLDSIDDSNRATIRDKFGNYHKPSVINIQAVKGRLFLSILLVFICTYLQILAIR